MYDTINRFAPDLKKMGWHWFVAVGCPLAFATELKGGMQIVAGACLGIVLLLTLAGLARLLLIDPAREVLFQIDPSDPDFLRAAGLDVR